MEISTNINLGTVSADIDVDTDDISEGLQPYISDEVQNQLNEWDWDFVDDMILDRISRGGLGLEDIVSDAIANSNTEVDGAGIAEDLLREYLSRDALGSSDDTQCHLAHSFEKAVRLANQRNTRSSDGAGIAATVVPAIHGLEQRLVELERIVRRLTMADRNHATATDLITSTLNDVTLFVDPDRDQEQPILG
jgi:hypothetical protein